MVQSILDMDATQLAQKIRNGEISSLAATNAYIEQIKRANPKTNALVEERFELARKEATACDQSIKEGNAKGRLFGVPISMKECFDVAGMKTTGGLIQRKDYIADTDAEVVAKLRAEGAIILGKTNTPTLCFCQETDNKLYGRTNNPWDLNRTVGGSSGGEAAIIAFGGAAVGIGSDIGGSIRFPAHFNGVIGFKSGNRQVSQKGHFPYVSEPLQENMLGFGALAKSVNDAELINEIIAEHPPNEIGQVDFSVIIPNPSPKFPVNNVTKELLGKVEKVLSQSYQIKKEQPPYLNQMALMWQRIMSIDGAKSVARIAFGNSRLKPLREFLREKLLHNAEVHPYLAWACIGANLFKPNQKQIEEIKAFIKTASETYQQYLHNSILILPVYHSAAKPHGEVYKEIFSIRKTFLTYLPYIALPNTLGLPTLVIPVGTDEQGMPISVQLICLIGNEKALFQTGRILEQSMRGYVRCRYYDDMEMANKKE